MRYIFQGRARDNFGNVVEEIPIKVYEAGTNNIVKVYENEIGGSPIQTLPQTSSDSNGFFEFWIDEADYSFSQFFDVVVNNIRYKKIDIIDVLAPYRIDAGNSKIEIVDTGTGYATIVMDGSEVGRWTANGLTLCSDILPDMTGGSGNVSTHSIGASAQRIKEIYTEHLYSGSGSIYIDGASIDDRFVRTDLDTDVNAHTEWQDSKEARFGDDGDLKIYHDGSNSYIDNVTGNLYLRVNTNENALVAIPNAAVELYYNGAKKFETTNTGIQITGLEVNGDTLINGDLIVNGTEFITHSEHVSAADNLITINAGASGSGVARGYAGIEVDRGSAPAYRFIFDETDDNFQIGEVGSLQAVATREDTPQATGISFWNSGEFRFDTSPGLIYTGNQLTLSAGTGIDEFSIDGTLTGNSDDAVPTEKAVKAYVDNATADSGDWDTAYSERRQWDGGNTNLVAGTGRTSLELGNHVTHDYGTGSNKVTQGDDGRLSDSRKCDNSFDSAATSRTNLELGNHVTHDYGTVINKVTQGNDSRLSDSRKCDNTFDNATTSRSNLSLGSIALLSSINNGNWTGTDLALTNGGTGASDAGTARTNLGLTGTSNTTHYHDSRYYTESEVNALVAAAGMPPGFVQRSKFIWKSVDDIYMEPGCYIVKDKIARWDTKLTSVSIGTPTASTWYYLYIDYSAFTSGVVITSGTGGIFDWSSTAPTWSVTQHGWYNGDDRCIFAVYSDGSQNIAKFYHDGNLVLLDASIQDYSDNVSTAWVDDISLTVPGFTTLAQITYELLYSNIAAQGLWRTNGSGVTPSHGAGYVSATNLNSMNTFTAITDSSQRISVRNTEVGTNSIKIHTDGWCFPVGI